MKRIWLAAIVCLAATIGGGASAAYACTKSGPPVLEHCYAEAGWYNSNLGTKIWLRTFFASVPNVKEEFVTNEQWDGFSPSGWVEAGDRAGVDYAGESRGLDYFTAVRYPPGSSLQGYYEAVFNNGPGADNWFEDDIHAAGSGVWSIFLGGENVWNWGNLPGVAARAHAGMEASDEDIVSSGQMTNFSYWSSTTGQLVSGWSGDVKELIGHTCESLDSDIGGSFENNC